MWTNSRWTSFPSDYFFGRGSSWTSTTLGSPYCLSISNVCCHRYGNRSRTHTPTHSPDPCPPFILPGQGPLAPGTTRTGTQGSL